MIIEDFMSVIKQMNINYIRKILKWYNWEHILCVARNVRISQYR